MTLPLLSLSLLTSHFAPLKPRVTRNLSLLRPHNSPDDLLPLQMATYGPD